MSNTEQATLREAIKKASFFWTLSKRGGGGQPESKTFAAPLSAVPARLGVAPDPKDAAAAASPPVSYQLFHWFGMHITDCQCDGHG